MPMLPFLHVNGTVFERRIPLASVQVTAAPRPEIQSVSLVDRVSQLQSERMKNGRQPDASQRAFHAIVRLAAKQDRYKRVLRPCSERQADSHLVGKAAARSLADPLAGICGRTTAVDRPLWSAVVHARSGL